MLQSLNHSWHPSCSWDYGVTLKFDRLWYGLCSLYRCFLPINNRPHLFYVYKKDGINTINVDHWFVLFTEQLKLSLEMSLFIMWYDLNSRMVRLCNGAKSTTFLRELHNIVSMYYNEEVEKKVHYS